MYSIYNVYVHTFQVLPSNKSMKPQGSHLQTRVEYLLKLLQAESKEAQKKVSSHVTVI